MLDDDEKRPDEAVSAHGQHLLSALRTHRPAVPVVVKRRRVAPPTTEGAVAAPLGTDTNAASNAERSPRVFRVEGAGVPAPEATTEPAAADGAASPRRRAAPDPMRRPGEVTRIVFERPEPEPEPEPAPAAPPSFVPAGYAEVQASLERVRAELGRARLARRFRIG